MLFKVRVPVSQYVILFLLHANNFHHGRGKNIKSNLNNSWQMILYAWMKRKQKLLMHQEFEAKDWTQEFRIIWSNDSDNRSRNQYMKTEYHEISNNEQFRY